MRRSLRLTLCTPGGRVQRRCGWSEIEHGRQGCIDSPLLLLREVSDDVTEAADINGPDVLRQHPCAAPGNVDGGAK